MDSLLQHRVVIAALLFCLSLEPAIGLEQAAEPDSAPKAQPDTPRIVDGNPADAWKKGYWLQDDDDISLPIKPIVPKSAAVEARNEGLAWYMVGRLFNQRADGQRSAHSAFRKAVKHDPKAIEIYRNLVPLEFAFGDPAAAVGYATEAVKLDGEEYNILNLLAIQAAQAGQLPEAIKFLEQAVKSPRISQTSPEFVALNVSLGKLYLKTGQTEPAADCYQVLLDVVKTPEKYGIDQRGKNRLLMDPLTNYEQIGQVLLDANRIKLALEAFELAGKSSRLGAGNLSFNRARILYLSEKYEDALAELQTYIDAQRTSKGRMAYQLLADILAKLNRSDELIQRLETIAENDSKNVALQYFFADRLAEVNELERARSIYDSMLRSGGDVSGYAGLARVLRKMHKSGELLDALARGFARGQDAIILLEPEIKALSEDKELMASLIEVGRTRAKDDELKFEEAYLLAKFAVALKDADAAGEFYELAIALNRNGNRPSVLIQMEMAENFLKLRKFRLAAEAFQEILASRQLNEVGQARIYSSLAQALAYDHKTDEAIEAIGKAIGIDDDNAEFRFYEAWIYSHARRWEDAIRKFEQLMKDFPDEKQVLLLSQFTLSNVYVQMGQMPKGEEILEKILEVNPENSQVNNDLGYLWADQGKNLERAEKMIRRALAAEPENAAYLDSLGWVLFKLGKYEESIPPLEQACQKNSGGDGTIWDHLGDALLKTMQVDKAVEAWKTALKHLEEDTSGDEQLVERIKDKIKQHDSKTGPRPPDKGTP